jgi:hypothetical protein
LDFLHVLESNTLNQLLDLMWQEFLVKPFDEMPPYSIDDFLKDWYSKAKWFEIYDLIEFFMFFHGRIEMNTFISKIENSLKREVAAYRIINYKVVPITSVTEIEEIDQALRNTSIWNPVNNHLSTSLKYLSDRENPDYRNSIKESISAVESLCVIITKDKKASLGTALARINKEWSIHPSLKSAFTSLYAYTSDESGIRHKLLENGNEISFEDAKFMLVSCSAFVNYLKARINAPLT